MTIRIYINILFFQYKFIYFNWRLITLQYYYVLYYVTSTKLKKKIKKEKKDKGTENP